MPLTRKSPVSVHSEFQQLEEVIVGAAHPPGAFAYSHDPELRDGLDATALLPKAVEAGMAFVPGAAFYADAPRANTLRLSFVTVAPAQIEAGVAALAGVLKAVA